VGTSWVAVAALGVSLVNTATQITVWWRGRHKVSAALQQASASVREPSGDFRTRDYAVVTVRNSGRQVGVDSIDFDWLEPSAPSSWGYHVATLEPWVRTPVPPVILDPQAAQGVRRVLLDGEMPTWYYEITSQGAPPTRPDGRVRVRALVRLTNGKRLRTNETWIVPRVLPDPDFPLGGASRDESDL